MEVQNPATMNTQEQLIRRFYTAFQQKDYKTMQSLYADNATFSDAVFQNLSSSEVKAMWQMLITASHDLKIEFSEVSADDRSGRARWDAWYTFTSTGRKVHNIIHANFEFRDWKIVKHIDTFNFWRWSRQALGLPGLLLGWSPLLRNKVRLTAKRRLEKYMEGVSQ